MTESSVDVPLETLLFQYEEELDLYFSLVLHLSNDARRFIFDSTFRKLALVGIGKDLDYVIGIQPKEVVLVMETIICMRTLDKTYLAEMLKLLGDMGYTLKSGRK